MLNHCVIVPRVIAFRISELAKQKGLTSAYQLQMAMNVPPNTAHRWWKGEMRNIDVDSLDRLCAFFECEPGDIIKRVVIQGAKAPRAGRKK